jgi:hypothetical protein
MYKLLKNPEVEIGPFKEVERIENGYLCDGRIYSDDVIGGPVEITETTRWHQSPRAFEAMRKKRNELLAASDVFVLADRWDSYTEAERTAWANYRQALRDLPQTIDDINNIVWPIKPE